MPRKRKPEKQAEQDAKRHEWRNGSLARLTLDRAIIASYGGPAYDPTERELRRAGDYLAEQVAQQARSRSPSELQRAADFLIEQTARASSSSSSAAAAFATPTREPEHWSSSSSSREPDPDTSNRNSRATEQNTHPTGNGP